jgi:hypothetical protein
MKKKLEGQIRFRSLDKIDIRQIEDRFEQQLFKHPYRIYRRALS